MSKAAPAAAPAEWNAPDKYLVKNDAGEVDWQATARKIDEGRSHLEKRMGSGDVPPADVAGYKVAAPEQYAEILKDWNPAEDQALQSFLTNAHKAGMTQKQVELVIGEYGRVMSQVQGMQLTPEQQAEKAAEDAAKALTEVWGADFDKNLALTRPVGEKFAEKLGVPFEDFDAALGSNPMFLRLAAALAPEMAEDKPQGTQTGITDVGTWEAQVAELKAQRDTFKDNDPRRAQITKQLSELYEKRYPS